MRCCFFFFHLGHVPSNLQVISCHIAMQKSQVADLMYSIVFPYDLRGASSPSPRPLKSYLKATFVQHSNALNTKTLGASFRCCGYAVSSRLVEALTCWLAQPRLKPKRCNVPIYQKHTLVRIHSFIFIYIFLCFTHRFKTEPKQLAATCRRPSRQPKLPSLRRPLKPHRKRLRPSPSQQLPSKAAMSSVMSTMRLILSSFRYTKRL